MANDEHAAILRQGVQAWNAWRQAHNGLQPDLSHAELAGFDLSHAKLMWTALYGADLRGALLNNADLFRADLIAARLSGAQLREADLRGAFFTSPNPDLALLSGADFSDADLTGANLTKVDLTGVNFQRATLRGARVSGSSLEGADLRDADLRDADLSGVLFVGTRLQGADLSGCTVYGSAVWNVQLEGARQANLRVSHWNEPALVVDNLEVAQFLYLLIHNERLRSVIDTITSKVVLILGRFTPERKAVLDAIRAELRRRDYVPILFDFEAPTSRDLTETVSTLAHLARFIVADITEAKSIPQELERIVPQLPSVPVQPLLLEEATAYGMFEHFTRYPWVLPIRTYDRVDALLGELAEQVVDPAERKAQELQRRT